MNVGKLVRLNRLFSHPSGRLCSVAVDHFKGRGSSYGIGMAASLLMSTVPIIVFLLMQKQMVQGLTIGALKG